MCPLLKLNACADLPPFTGMVAHLLCTGSLPFHGSTDSTEVFVVVTLTSPSICPVLHRTICCHHSICRHVATCLLCQDKAKILQQIEEGLNITDDDSVWSGISGMLKVAHFGLSPAIGFCWTLYIYICIHYSSLALNTCFYPVPATRPPVLQNLISNLLVTKPASRMATKQAVGHPALKVHCLPTVPWLSVFRQDHYHSLQHALFTPGRACFNAARHLCCSQVKL